MWKLPSGFVGEYAEQDVKLTQKLWDVFRVKIAKEELDSIFNLELDLLPLLIEMTRKGVRINMDRAEELDKEFDKEEKEILQKIKKETGIKVEIWAAASVAQVFDYLKIKYERTKTNKTI